MATRSTIALEFDDGVIKQVYCHWDGYLEGVGQTLLNHYTSPEKVEALIKQGAISILGEEIGDEHDFSDTKEGKICTFYKRDRGDTCWRDLKYFSLDDYETRRQYEEFDYFMTKDGVWNVFFDDEWHDLEYILEIEGKEVDF